MHGKKTLGWMAAAVVAGSVLLASPASAAPGRIAQRKGNQQDRIAQGVKSGQLTAGETARLERKEAGLNKEIRGMRQENGGKLSPRRSRPRESPAEPALAPDLPPEARRADPGTLTLLPEILLRARAPRGRFLFAPHTIRRRMSLLAIAAGVALLVIVLWDAFETIVLPRRASFRTPPDAALLSVHLAAVRGRRRGAEAGDPARELPLDLRPALADRAARRVGGRARLRIRAPPLGTRIAPRRRRPESTGSAPTST